MYIEVNFHRFKDAFKYYARDDHFSHEALEALYAYLNNSEFHTGVQNLLNIAELCKNFQEIEQYDPTYQAHLTSDKMIARLPASILIHT